jgi:GNAT superfamily N-acetyltransferase
MIATTYLQMLSKDEHRPKYSADPRFQALEVSVKQWQYNRFLYSLVGAEWEWLDKLGWSDAQWAEYAQSATLRTFVGYYDGSLAGYFELLQNAADEVELAYFGLAPQFIGRGLGGPLLTAAIEEAWNMQPRRVWVHTCTLDHPNALKNYQARGFSIYKVEAAPAK